MFVINAQAYALTTFLYDATKWLTRRARPWAVDLGCPNDPNGPGCGAGSRYRSFYSGHAAMTATGAGLVCAHHTQLSLYQNDVLDAGACIVAVLGTAVTGAMRVASDNHWASDVLMGHVMGYASGYLLPTLIYYGNFSALPHEHGPNTPVVAALPMAGSGVLGLRVFGLF
jgi:membrane-associated phospholipid phosphatase